MEPSTAWREQIADGEARTFQAAAERLTEIQRARSLKQGHGRALHRKQVMAAKGSFEVLPNLPAYAAHGLFAEPGVHETWVRLSNGGMDIAPDRRPDIRGFSMKVLGVHGESALGGPAKSQDFALINREVFGFSHPDAFFGLIFAVSRGVPALIWHFIQTHGFFAGLGQLQALQKSQARPFAGFAADRFFSAAPIKCGPYAARVRLIPVGSPVAAKDDSDYGADFAARLLTAPLVYDFQLQFFVDEKQTPIEDGAVDWPESIAPYLTVARLTIAQQDATSSEGRAFSDAAAASTFDPWAALAEHRPLGAIMRARKVAYFASQKTRGVV